MSNLMSIMLCRHKKSKKKLVSLAIDSRYGHEQGFKLASCCKYCGKIIKNPPESGKKLEGSDNA